MIESTIESIHQTYLQVQELLTNTAFQEYGIIGLFFNSLLSATAIPLPTEILTSALLIGGESQILVGTVLVMGSVLGGMINYALGCGGGKLFKKFRKSATKIQDTHNTQNNTLQKILKKLGWSGIFFSSWIPFFGDLILISAGVKKTKLWKFLLLMITGKIFKTVLLILGLGALF
mgnify:FL=1